MQKARADEFQHFWSDFLDVLELEDPEQPKAKPTRDTNIKFSLPAPNSWLSVYRTQNGHVGLFLSSTKNTPGRYAMQAIADDFDAIKGELRNSQITRPRGCSSASSKSSSERRRHFRQSSAHVRRAG